MMVTCKEVMKLLGVDYPEVDDIAKPLFESMENGEQVFTLLPNDSRNLHFAKKAAVGVVLAGMFRADYRYATVTLQTVEAAESFFETVNGFVNSSDSGVSSLFRELKEKVCLFVSNFRRALWTISYETGDVRILRVLAVEDQGMLSDRDVEIMEHGATVTIEPDFEVHIRDCP